MRPIGLREHTLPVHPQRRDDELLSSWIVRLARANRMKVHTLCIRLGGNLATIWNRDVDRMAPPWVLEGLSRLTAVPAAEIRQGTLADLAEKIDVDHHPNGMATWILPLGVWHRKRHAFGVQFCPICLRMDGDAYIRRAWRLAYYTECEYHRVLLADRCPKCRKPLTYFRGELGDRDAIYAPSMRTCAVCDFDLGYAPVEQAVWPAWELTIAVRTLQFMNDFGWAALGDRIFVPAPELLLALRQVIKAMGSAQRDGQLYDAVADQIWPQGYTALGNRGAVFENRSVVERHRLFGMAVWLLQDWPERFQDCVRTSGIHRYCLTEARVPPPAWFVDEVGVRWPGPRKHSAAAMRRPTSQAPIQLLLPFH